MKRDIMHRAFEHFLKTALEGVRTKERILRQMQVQHDNREDKNSRVARLLETHWAFDGVKRKSKDGEPKRKAGGKRTRDGKEKTEPEPTVDKEPNVELTQMPTGFHHPRIPKIVQKTNPFTVQKTQ